MTEQHVDQPNWLRVIDVFHCGQAPGYNVDAVCVVNRDQADRADAVDHAAAATAD